MQNRITYLVFTLISISALVLSRPGGAGNRSRSSSAESSGALAAALLGGSTTRAKPTERSLFDSDFWKTGVSDKPIADDGRPGRREGEPELLEPASAGNPVNPETNQPFSDAVMEQFSDLRKKFPNNSIIPRRRSDEDIKTEEKQRQEVFGLQTKVFQNQASKEDIDTFYDYQSKGIRDRLELLDYVVKESGSEMSPDIKAKYEQILQMNKNQLQSFEEARKRAHATSRQ
ncbi:MAG: hypothetical protein K8S54_16935 [Spirochaetia bacterium]|nr:hypothetical protein [Spirochaetia bacterium]